jgi:murein DD-endopeptidase MepM/ murein hydrolase activator NlpD
MASPEYPIRPGEAAGDGALHMTQHPQYPIDPAASASAAPPAAPAQPAPPPPPPADDDAPRAVPHSTVETTDLPPPSASSPPQTPAPQSRLEGRGARFEYAMTLDRSSLLAATLRDAISDDGRPAFDAAEGFERVVLHRRRHIVASKDESAKAGGAHKGKIKAKPKRGRHGEHGQIAATSSRSAHRHTRLHTHAEAAAPAEVSLSEVETPYQTRVRPGERAADVAARLHVSKQALMALNGIKPTRKLRPGEVLKTPYRLVYTVGQGDTLFAISHRFGQEMDEVAKLNGLKPGAALHLGQTVALPLTAEDAGPRGHAKGKAPQPQAAPPKLIEAELVKARAAARRAAREEAARLARAAPSSPSLQGAPAQVAAPDAESDNGARLAAELNARELANRAAAPTSGSSSASGYSVSKEMAAERPAASPWSTPTPAAAASAPARVATLNAPGYTAPSYYPPGYTPPGYTAPSSTAPAYNGPVLGRVRPTAPTGMGAPVSDADVSTAGRGRFVWPLRGAILSPFGDRGPGQRNDGLDISASPGESVRAAASGEVVYAGSSIPGFGNLVLVKHPGGWVTAYAHLDRIEVRMRDEVSQGEEIGQAGQTGAVDRPELHFEIRYAPDPADKARPVDPTLVLPGPAKGDG